MKRLFWPALLAGLALLLTAAPALAARGPSDEIVLGDNYTLKAGETLNGNLVVYGGNALLEAGSHVTGDVVLVGGSLSAAGEIGGDAVVIGGSGHLLSTAVVRGDLAAVGATVNREAGAQVLGQDINTVGPRWSPGFSLSGMPFWRWVDAGSLGLGMALRAFGWSVALGVLALLVLLFWPEQTARVGQAALAAPLAAGAMGLITAVTGAVIFSVLILLLCLGLLGWVALVAAVLFGWIALGALVGARLAPALRLTGLDPAAAGALGTFALTLGMEALRLVPCLGPAAAVLLASLGLGAVILTRFGTRPYVVAPPSPPPAPVEAA